MGSANSLCVTVLGGHDRAKGEPWVMIEPSMVGWGATDERDGNCVTSPITNGDTFNYSIELLEAKFPVRVNQYMLNTPGGVGAGRYRGGYGSIREYEIMTDDAVLSASYGRSIEKPWAREGGAEGSVNYFELHVGNDARRAARAPTTVMKRGDIIRMFTGGGGGYGDPFERPADEVARGGPRGLHLRRAGAGGLWRRHRGRRARDRRGGDRQAARGRRLTR